MHGSECNGPAPAGRRSKPAVVRRRAQPSAGWPWMLAIIIVFPFLAEAAEVESSSPGGTVYQSNNLAIGVGLGIVKFDSKVKVRDKQTGGRRFLDLEGNLDLPETDRVDIVYGAYNFNARHSLVFSYFAIRRDSVLRDFKANYDDIILLRATIEVEDKSSFFDLGYGYNLFRDDRSSVTAVAGVNLLDLKLVTTASGDLTVDGVT
jgi:hypothetical protein